jgi:chaperonin GroES
MPTATAIRAAYTDDLLEVTVEKRAESRPVKIQLTRLVPLAGAPHGIKVPPSGGLLQTRQGGNWLPMKIRPLGDRILVMRIKEEDKTKGGIIIPDTAKEKPQEGKVVAVGKGKMTEAGKLVAPDVKAGDRILFGKYSGSEVKLEGEEHLILREDDILGVLEG